MYSKGMKTRQISDTLEDIYDFEDSEGFVSSNETDKIMPQIEDRKTSFLRRSTQCCTIDAIRCSVRIMEASIS